MSAVLLLPYRQNAAVVAKQAATLHVLSGGRLTLGVGIGSREEDHTAFGLPTKGRASAWTDARPDQGAPGGRPRRMALTYFALGDDPEGDTERSIGDYYSFAREYAAGVVAGTAEREDAVS